MRMLVKKFGVIFVILIFLVSGLATVSVASTQRISLDESGFIKTLTLYRYGSDGSITPVKVDLKLKKGQDIDEAIVSICDQLFENDNEMQNILKTSNFTGGIFCKVKSHGRGFHYKSMFPEKILLKFALFKLGLPRVSSILRKPLIVCRYSKDLKAKTTIMPLISGNTTTTVEGNHTVIVYNFIGYTTWISRFSKSPLDLLPRAFSGIARFAICNKLP